VLLVNIEHNSEIEILICGQQFWRRESNGNKLRAVPFVLLRPVRSGGMERGGMSSADPTEVGPSNLASGDTLRRGRLSEKRPTNTSDPALQEDTDVTSEKPQADPEDRKTDHKPPETDPTQEQGPQGVKGAFQKHPI
jgi:hypothetical protein